MSGSRGLQLISEIFRNERMAQECRSSGREHVVLGFGGLGNAV